MPTSIRIRPTVVRSTPEIESVTAKRRIAPTAMRRREVPIPMARSYPGPIPFIRMSTTLTDVYEIPQEHKDFRDLVRQLATERIAPRAAEIDATDEYPWD